MYENCYGHPFSSSNQVFQHRLVAERHLLNTNPTSRCLVEVGGNKYLDPDLVVHHKNQIRDDNRIENLQIMTGSAHQALHNRLRAKRNSNL
ncbi:MAG: hypothetical protein A2Y38_12195 [Spirochaetes bacterium GWB1_59_5]|nr:MAG: hypothetical protein A2Y38_12195 [Spirochaetes bacterium GWB1_59_5]